MNILYVSCSASSRCIGQSLALSSTAVQKFHAAIIQGLISNYQNVSVLSSTPAQNGKDCEFENGVNYNYLTPYKGGFRRYLSLFLKSFTETCKFLMKNKDAVVICDVLNVMISTGAMLAARMLKRKVVGIVTDLPGLMVGTTTSTIGMSTKINKWMITKFTHYVLLTEAMNDIVNPQKVPYIVMEGIADISNVESNISIFHRRKVIIYAGGLFERYGVKKLIDSFIKIANPEFVLHLYGDGDVVEYAKSLSNYGVKYLGIQPNNVVLEDEKNAWLLVNPRPSCEEFTKYSFPSKNIEYMLSGTPILTTRLPGMPSEYYQYVYIVQNETIDGFVEAMSMIMSYKEEEIDIKGKKAQDFIVQFKNSVAQAERIVNLCEN